MTRGPARAVIEYQQMLQKQTPPWKTRVTAARRKVREVAVVAHALA